MLPDHLFALFILFKVYYEVENTKLTNILKGPRPAYSHGPCELHHPQPQPHLSSWRAYNRYRRLTLRHKSKQVRSFDKLQINKDSYRSKHKLRDGRMAMWMMFVADYF